MWLGNFTQRLKTNPWSAPNKQTAVDQLLKETVNGTTKRAREIAKQKTKKWEGAT